MNLIPSLYILNNTHKKLEQNFLKNDFIILSLRPHYVKNLMAVSSTRDLLLYFYENNNLYLNNENTLIYPIQHYFLLTVIENQRMQRIKHLTENNFELSMYAAVSAMNIMLDLYHEQYMMLDFNTQRLISDLYALDIRYLFDPQFEQFQTYPKDIMVAQSKIVKKIRESIFTHKECIDAKMKDIVQLIEELNFTDTLMFK